MRQILSRAVHVRDLHDSLAEVQQNPRQVAQIPPSSNTGGTSPLPLDPKAPQRRVKIDWLAFTSGAGYSSVKEVLLCLFPDVVITDNGKGSNGYPNSATLTLYGVHIGIFAWGADHGRDWLSITGEGCREWNPASYGFIRECLEAIDATLTRIDHALDFYKGEITYEDCEEALRAGEFKSVKGSRTPKVTRNSTEDEGRNEGRTLYVGKTKSASRFIRLYEKGLQIFANMPDEFRASCTDPHNLVWGSQERAPDGTIASQWLRAEVQNMNKERVLPLDMITETDDYFAGAYPFCARVLGLTDGLKPSALKPLVDIELHRSIANCRNSYGNLIYSLKQLGFTDTEIIGYIMGDRHNDRLVKSGLLARIQNDPTWVQTMRAQDSDIPF